MELQVLMVRSRRFYRRPRPSLRVLLGSLVGLVLWGLPLGPAPRAQAPVVAEEGGWQALPSDSALNPINRRGRHPIYVAHARQLAAGPSPADVDDHGAGSSNFLLTVPLLHMPGRGPALTLALTYNARLWHLAPVGRKEAIHFDIDADWPAPSWPAPGWSLGFPKVILTGSGPLLIDADGTRHPLVGTATFDTSGSTFVGQTYDGTFIRYTERRRLDGTLLAAQATYPDGTVLDFTVPGRRGGSLYATRLTDAHGNYLTITYRPEADGTPRGPEIATIIDTLGRPVTFHYDSDNLLTAITAPGVGGTQREVLRLHYTRRPLQYRFAPDLGVYGARGPLTVINALYFPGTATGYWFDDTDSYSPYGMIRKVEEQRGMGFVATSVHDQGSVSPGRYTRRRTYDYPADLHHDPLRDAPAYRTMTEERVDMPTAVTHYRVWQDTSPRRVEIIHPDGTRTVQLSHRAGWADGLMYQTDTYSPDGAFLQRTALEWERAAAGPTDLWPRLKSKTVSDERGQEAKTAFAYGDYNQVTEVREYDYDRSLARKTVTAYALSSDPPYVQRHLFHLPTTVQVYDGAGTLVAQTDFSYDSAEPPLVDTPGVVHHNTAFNPYAPPRCEETCRRVCEDTIPPSCRTECKTTCVPQYDPATQYRGNLTQITRSVEAATPSAGATTETRHYDITGNLVATSTAPHIQTRYTYTQATQYAYPDATTRGATAPIPAARLTTQARYDFNTGVLLATTDANGRTAHISYSAATLRPEKVTFPTGAWLSYEYNEAEMRVTETMYEPSGTLTNQRVRRFNGLGSVHQEATLAEGGWDIVETQYDVMGRLAKQTVPYRYGEAPQWSEWTYDGLGRVTQVRLPDGSTMRSYYNERSHRAWWGALTGAWQAVTVPSRPAWTASGQTVRTVDAWGRERHLRHDALGHVQEVVEPNPEGRGTMGAPASLVTRYRYDALGHLTQVEQGDQRRTFRYDALGRLTHQWLPEKQATLDDRGVYVGPGAQRWSDVFTYDPYGNLTAHTDARGVTTRYDYGNDPLHRLQRVTYDQSGVGDPASPVLAAPEVTYQYRPSGDVTQLARVTTSEVSTEEYTYDPEGRLTTKTLTLNSWPSAPLVIDYAYDSLHRVTAIHYPAQYGIPGAPRQQVHVDYGLAHQIRGLTVDDAAYASQIAYNAAGQMTALVVGGSGPGQLRETYAYDGGTGQVRHQQVRRADRVLLDLTYDYLRAGTTSGQTGQVTQITNTLDGRKSRSYEYDVLGRLQRATGGSSDRPLWRQEYGYDRYSNRTGVTAAGVTEHGAPMPRDGWAVLSYDTSTNRITTPGFAYDAAGNLIRGQRADGTWQRYQYDAAGRLVQVVNDAGVVLEVSTYGASRQRLWTQTEEPSHERTYSVWDGEVVLTQYREREAALTGPQWAMSSVYLGGRLLATILPGGASERVQYSHPDRLGTRLITQAADAATVEQETLPYGVALEGESPGTTHQYFTSYDRSAITGLDYAINRHYDPQQGRFLQVDPLGITAARLGSPQSLNLYAYVQNDPVNSTDPTGLEDQRCIADPNGKLYCVDEEIVVVAPSIEVVVISPSTSLDFPLAPPQVPRGTAPNGEKSDGTTTKPPTTKAQCLAQYRQAYAAQFSREQQELAGSIRESTWALSKTLTVLGSFSAGFGGPAVPPIVMGIAGGIEISGRYFSQDIAKDLLAWKYLPGNIMLGLQPPCR